MPVSYCDFMKKFILVPPPPFLLVGMCCLTLQVKLRCSRGQLLAPSSLKLWSEHTHSLVYTFFSLTPSLPLPLPLSSFPTMLRLSAAGLHVPYCGGLCHGCSAQCQSCLLHVQHALCLQVKPPLFLSHTLLLLSVETLIML